MAMKKTQKQRGSRTCGWGAGKKHRGAGSRGGKGRAGMGKRGQQRKSLTFARGKIPYGKERSKAERIRKKTKIINLNQIDAILDRWVAEGKATKDKTLYSLDLDKLGYDKILSSGKLTKNVKIKINAMSKKTKQKLGIKTDG